MRGRISLALLLALASAGCDGTKHASTSPPFTTPVVSSTRPAVPSIATVKVTNDDFNTPTLNGATWKFVNPNGRSTLSMDGTHAQINVPAGSNTATHDPNAHGDLAPRLMQTIRNGNFSFDAKFDSEVTQQFQEQGVVAEQDPTHYLYAKIVQNYFETALVVQVVSGSTVTTSTNVQIYDRASIILRLARRGDHWAVGYSYDGFSWTAADAFVHHLAVRQVGVFGGNAGNTAPPFTARVDSFLETARTTAAPLINVWYGPDQTFGTHGQPQQWVNILGDVVDPNGMSRLTYSLNRGPAQNLSMGENAVRLVAPGEFNAEIDDASLRPGANTVKLVALDNDGNASTTTVTVNKVVGKVWPLPYTANWSTAGGKVNTLAQIADGHWTVQADGTIRDSDIGYDRLVTIGQARTWSQYTATAQVTIHSTDPDSSSVGIIAGFTGATSDLNGTPTNDQPRSGHPFAAAFLYDNMPGQPQRVEIYANSDTHPEQTLVADTTGTQLATGVAYTFEISATDNDSGGSLFRFKIWKTGTAEPTSWLLQANGDLNRGSIVLAAHRADVSFGTVTVRAAS